MFVILNFRPQITARRNGMTAKSEKEAWRAREAVSLHEANKEGTKKSSESKRERERETDETKKERHDAKNQMRRIRTRKLTS